MTPNLCWHTVQRTFDEIHLFMIIEIIISSPVEKSKTSPKKKKLVLYVGSVLSGRLLTVIFLGVHALKFVLECHYWHRLESVIAEKGGREKGQGGEGEKAGGGGGRRGGRGTKIKQNIIHVILFDSNKECWFEILIS